ncbi:PREDICTED: uncharacterized protein LOC104748816 [Camelina sativa]|uniref:Uncharacterized protein LOC104748816 n=1 Tax=Camelina sativa TaxID=90675 RepID=A0ABM0WBM9_CAMSA|nr:PREDICTED: uncharacterized protein LOC104748816 [Camelina sativa]
MALDTASRGDFSTNTANEANLLIENLAASNSNHGTEYDRSVRVNAVETDAIKDLTAKVNLLLKRDHQGVNMCEEQTGVYAEFGVDASQDATEEDQIYPPQPQQNNFTQGFQAKGKRFGGSNFQQKPQANSFAPGFQAPQQQPAAPQESKLEQMMQALIDNQKKNAGEINVKIDNMYSELNGRIETLNTHVRVLENQVAQASVRVKAPPGTLPCKSEANPKEFLNAITLRSGKEIEGPPLTKRTDRSSEQTGRSGISENNNDPLSNTQENADDVEISGTKEADKEPNNKPQQTYTPKLPFPTRRKTKIQERKYVNLKSVVGELQVRLCFIETVRMVPSLKKYMKEMLTDKLSLEQGVMYLTHACSAMLHGNF